MKPLKDLLIGYCDPNILAISDRPIGETGLTRRITWIARIWQISAALRRPRLWRFGRLHFPDVFLTFVATVDQAWLTELLRVMDRGRSSTPRGPTENLTIELCHERFQAEPAITVVQKSEERKRYSDLMVAYESAGLRDFRNHQMFHLDLTTALAPPQDTGNILTLTNLLVEWFEHVGSAVFGAEPRFVTCAHLGGKKAVREFRRMLTARLRELVGKPKLHKKRFTSPAWNALCARVVNSIGNESADSP